MNRMIPLALLAALLPSLCRAQKLQISTNALGLACLGTLNVEVEYAVDRHWSVGATGKYNPFSYGRDSEDGQNQFQLRQRCVAAQARWWPWHIYSGWWVSGRVQWQEYNFGGIFSPTTEEGQKYGAGLSAGYAHMISEHWNVEAGMGLWGGMKQYTVYACPTCGRRTGGGIKPFVLPDNFIVAISYVF